MADIGPGGFDGSGFGQGHDQLLHGSRCRDSA